MGVTFPITVGCNCTSRGLVKLYGIFLVTSTCDATPTICHLTGKWLLQSLEETLHTVREAMTRPQAAVQLNLDNDDSLDTFIEVQGNFDEDLPYLAEGNLLPFLSSLELQQHDF